MLSRLDQLSLLGMMLGVALMILSWSGDVLRFGFFITLSCTLLQIVVGRLRAGETQR
jgi:hypothetical protein